MHPSLGIPLLIAAMASSLPAHGMSIGLFDFLLNQDGVTSNLVPSGSAFDSSQGLGTLRMAFSTPGPHVGGLFVDHELSEAENTFFNEVGSAIGSPPARLTWEIDEPGFGFGDIYDNFLLASLDNSVGTTSPEDVSMALLWNFNLSPSQSAQIEFILGTTEPGGFHLRHVDPDSGEMVYFSSSLSIRSNPTGVPDGDAPTAITILGTCIGIGFWRARSRVAARQQNGQA